MASTQNNDYTYRDVGNVGGAAVEVLNAATIYKGAVVTCDAATGAAKQFDGTETDTPLGWAQDGPVTGTADRLTKVRVMPGKFTIVDLAVAALNNDASDIGAPVYAIDDNTFTTVSTGNLLVGVVIGSGSANGLANVYAYNLLERGNV